MSKKRQISFFDYPALFKEIESEVTSSVRDVFARGAYIMQRDLVEFEAELAQYLGVKHAIGVADGTMGLLLPLLTRSLPRGCEVILPSHTFVASAAAIHHAGAVPILVECGPDHLISAESVAAAINTRTLGIMPVHLNGRTANMDPLLQLASQHGLFIIEDACQALGSKFSGRYAGTFGFAGSISFYPSKTLGCFGDGGAVVTNDDETADAVRILRDHGRGPDGNVWCWGYNARLDNVQAAILRIKLRKYDEYVSRRRELASIYSSRLRYLRQLMLPPAPGAEVDHFDIYQNYEIEAENRDELRTHLEERGVRTVLQWGGKAIHQFPKLGYACGLPYTEQVMRRFMLLPMNTSLSDGDVHYICDCIEEFYAG